VPAVFPFFRDRRDGVAVCVVFCVMTGLFGGPYLVGFVRDSMAQNTRRAAADSLSRDTRDVHVIAEPAPYSVPPLNLFNRRWVLADPSEDTAGSGWFIRTKDRGTRTPISWANKPFDIQSK
jgi:hypothetical protein